MAGNGGSSIIAAWAFIGAMGPRPLRDRTRQAELDREDLQALERALYGDPDRTASIEPAAGAKGPIKPLEGA